jgi:hypothetical protein
VSLRGRVLRALLGVSAYDAPPSPLPSLDSPSVERSRRALGGQIVPLPATRLRFHLADLESAEYLADQGDLSMAAQLMNAAMKDGVVRGLLSTRTDGLVRLPKKFRGESAVVEALERGHDSVRSVFDEMCPPAELAAMAADGLLLGVSVGELLPVVGREYPVLVRLDPEFAIYRWSENRWYYRSVAGLLPITPGDGRWVLHVPGGRVAPWRAGLWRAIAYAWLRKTHAGLHKDAWEAKLANPARVAVAPNGASEPQKQAWWRAVMAWGVNTVFGVTPGYDVKLLESNGRGYESFESTEDRADRTFMICVAGQVVTTDGGAGFSNADIHKSIRADLIKATADGLSYTINTQIIPQYVVSRWDETMLLRSASVEWDVTPPKDRNSEAAAQATTATAIAQLSEALAPHGLRLDVQEVCDRAGIPVERLAAESEAVVAAVRSAIRAGMPLLTWGADGKPILAAWDEEKHPRADDGKFGSGSGSGSKAGESRGERAQAHFDVVATKVRDVARATGHAETMHKFLNVDRHAVSRAEREGKAHEVSDRTNEFLREAQARGAVYRGQVFRGTNPAELEQIMSGGANTTTWSTSKDPEGAVHFAKKGGIFLVMRHAGAVPVDGLEGSNTFSEALVPKGTRWKVTRERVTRSGVRVVHLEPAK